MLMANMMVIRIKTASGIIAYAVPSRLVKLLLSLWDKNVTH